jgi:hypothetical protein
MSKLPEGAPEILKDAMWTGNGMDGFVRKIISENPEIGWIECRYSEIKKGNRFVQFWDQRKKPQEQQIATALEDAHVYCDEGKSWGNWGVTSCDDRTGIN